MGSALAWGIGGVTALAVVAGLALSGKSAAAPAQTGGGGSGGGGGPTSYPFTSGHRYQFTLVCPAVPGSGPSGPGFTPVSGPTAGAGNTFVYVSDYTGPTQSVAIMLTGCTMPTPPVDMGPTPAAGACTIPENPSSPQSALCLVTYADQVSQVQTAVAAALAAGGSGVPGAPSYLPTDVSGNAQEPKWTAWLKVAQAYCNSQGIVAQAAAQLTPGDVTNMPTALRTDGALDLATTIVLAYAIGAKV